MAMMVVMPVIVPVTVRRAATHGDAARLAELRVLRFHAGRDPAHVGNDVGTKPHRIGRARLTRRIAALSGCAVETTESRPSSNRLAPVRWTVRISVP